MTLPTIPISHNLILTPEPLLASTFGPFGTVITSSLPPSLTSHPSPAQSLPQPLHPTHQPNLASANQATALKSSPISPLLNNYPPSTTYPSHGLTSIFSCFPRRNIYRVNSSARSNTDTNANSSLNESTPRSNSKSNLRLNLGILERHPYTTQTFCPFATSEPTARSVHDQTYILIIVAPTLSDLSSTPQNPPDVTSIKVFYAPVPKPGEPGVAVTYAPGTWHAPMIVLGARRVDFWVVQFANGIGEDDCQEVLLGGGPDEAGLDQSVRRERFSEYERGRVEVDLNGLHLDFAVEPTMGATRAKL